MEEFKTVSQVAKDYNVTDMAVRNWIKKGLKFKIEKVIGVKPRKIISTKDVKNFLREWGN
jgi:transposase-like protein